MCSSSDSHQQNNCFFFSTNEIVHVNSLKRLEQINASGIKMHYVSFNFGRDLGELRGTCAQV